MLSYTSRIRTVPKRYRFLINEKKDVLLKEDDEPITYEESLNSSESEKWFIAMKLEMDSMYTNQVWTLVDPPEGIKLIGCKWIFKKKTDMEGNVITYKQGRKCRDISSIFRVSGLPDTISANESQMKEKSKNICQYRRYIGHNISYKCSTWNKM